MVDDLERRAEEHIAQSQTNVGQELVADLLEAYRRVLGWNKLLTEREADKEVHDLSMQLTMERGRVDELEWAAHATIEEAHKKGHTLAILERVLRTPDARSGKAGE